jgi:hydrogenase expression/formation protein HypC
VLAATMTSIRLVYDSMVDTFYSVVPLIYRLQAVNHMCLAIPGKLTVITQEGEYRRAGKVDFGGVMREVNLSLVPEARPGDYVVVHVGTALSVVDEAEARQVFDYLRMIEEPEAIGDLLP